MTNIKHSKLSYGTAIDIGNDEGTQHISVIDESGLAVSLTTTINTYFGSKVVAKKSGIVLNNEMDDFVAQPGVPNSYGLIGSEANSVAPGAVPLSSMSPTILQAPDGTIIDVLVVVLSLFRLRCKRSLISLTLAYPQRKQFPGRACITNGLLAHCLLIRVLP